MRSQVAVAFGLGVGIAVALNRILHRRAGATVTDHPHYRVVGEKATTHTRVCYSIQGTVPDAVFALARQHVSEAR